MLLDSQATPAVPGLPSPAEAEPGKPAVWPAWLFIGALFAICGLTVFIGLAPVVMFGHDIFFFLDNCYRVLQGQIPHRDFQSAWGPLPYLILSLIHI